MDSSLYVCIIIDYFCGIFVGSDIFLASHLAISILISLAVGTHVVPKGDTLGPKPSLDFLYYGNTGCGVFKRGIQNWKDFCLRINKLKGNY